MGFENMPKSAGQHKETGDDLAPFRRGAIGEKLAEGSHATIHELETSEQLGEALVKIGKTTEYSPPLFRWLKLKFPREKASRFLEKVLGPEFKINPDEDFIKNGVAEYLLMKEYFGREKKGNPVAEAKQVKAENKKKDSREELSRALQDDNDPFYKEILKILGDKNLLAEAVSAVRRHQEDNFLPKEHVVIGHSPNTTREDLEKPILTYPPELPSDRQKPPATYYIVQERAKDRTGKDMAPLYELGEEDLKNRRELTEKLLTFALLTKKMYADTGQLIDTRPEEVGKHPLEWFQKTANVLVDKDGQDLRFVDTRWLWSENSRLGKGGLNIIDFFGARSVDGAIKKYAELLRADKAQNTQ